LVEGASWTEIVVCPLMPVTTDDTVNVSTAVRVPVKTLEGESVVVGVSGPAVRVPLKRRVAVSVVVGLSAVVLAPTNRRVTT
jgi:hypothetical protein